MLLQLSYVISLDTAKHLNNYVEKVYEYRPKPKHTTDIEFVLRNRT